MKVTSYENVTLENVAIEGAVNTKIRWLISQKDGAPNFALRMFEVEEGGNTPFHSHDYEHEVFVLQGEGVFVFEDKEHPFKKWDVIYVDPGKEHQFRNTGKEKMVFLCIIPHQPAQRVKKNINPFASGTVNNC
ncbi:MAG: cupin domain-containing protein [Candidatus Cloacimonetes bacterium]|nr:cupin domain-containing protein [Candidatus Cloacimonadota bacterium]